MKFLAFVLALLLFGSCTKTNTMESIKYIDRSSGEIKTENVPSEGMLKWLYSSPVGKASLHLLFKRKLFSAVGGWYMDSGLSKKRIKRFITEHQIDMTECKIEDASAYSTFNQFFYRELKPEARPVGDKIVSPADGKIVVFPKLNDIGSFFVKGSEFTVASFLQDKNLATKFENGSMAIVRLAPPDYHRYHFPASGKASESKEIKGHYFSVSPLALQGSLRIFCENKREYTLLESKEYGDIAIVDVGATMVGSIIQTYQANSQVEKGNEKGYFAFGGSTLVLLFEEGKIQFDRDLINNTQNGMETYIRMGENIAR